MSSNPHEIFTTVEDHWSWDKYIQQCDMIDLSDADRQHAKDFFKNDAVKKGWISGLH